MTDRDPDTAIIPRPRKHAATCRWLSTGTCTCKASVQSFNHDSELPSELCPDPTCEDHHPCCSWGDPYCDEPGMERIAGRFWCAKHTEDLASQIDQLAALDEDRLARALHAWRLPYGIEAEYADDLGDAAAIAKAYRKDSDAEH